VKPKNARKIERKKVKKHEKKEDAMYKKLEKENRRFEKEIK
jgi:hypothetical protein